MLTFVVLAVATAALIAGCGGRESKADYQKDVKAVGKSLDDAADDLDAINPPKEIESAHNELVKASVFADAPFDRFVHTRARLRARIVTMPDPARVQNMFDRIAGRYDLLNRVMTMGVDRRWRRVAVRAAGAKPGRRVLDVCCGTGDLTFFLADAGADSVGVDFSEGMLAQARERVTKQPKAIAERVEFQQGDAMALPFDDDSFDALTVGFGVRNVERLETAFAEFQRVVRPGGKVVCLEITRPRRFPFTIFYNVWFDRIVPVVGRLLSGDAEAYSYLPESTLAFPQPKVLAATLRDLGYRGVSYRTFAGGIVALHTAQVPAPADSNDSAGDASPEMVGVRG